jgi:hypothetical protein
MELDTEPNDLQRDPFPIFATQHQLVREELNGVSNQVLLASYLLSHDYIDDMR